ncbi:MAG: Fis family transcriptional regulator [Desulfobacteraceae bacterium IS3]|nr:MAG: Fis family transcriptional regulator [Desulfobacteraceae bacterium IS3]
MQQAKILIADDEAIARDNLRYILNRQGGYDIVTVESGARAIEEIRTQEFDLVLTDLRMQTVDGMKVVEFVKERSPDTEVIVITGYATVATAVEAMQKGAYHYVAKPYNIDEVRILVRQALEKRALHREVRELRHQIECQQTTPLLIGNDPKMQSVRSTIEQIAPTDCNVLILGETGTGKELVAKTIHQLSLRAEKRFLAVNCGAFTEDLLTNELFGHEKEAFTGARGVKKGLLETAHGGTVFLDEIGDMPLSMQVRLLRVLQERKFMRVGGTQEIATDIRIIAATNKDLLTEVENGKFRQDFYYRLNVITLNIPPLSERKESIPLLCQHFLRKFSQSYGKNITQIADEVMNVLLSYEFPGNVRELENIIERAVALSNTDTIEIRHLPPDLQRLPLGFQRQRKFMTLEENEKEYILWILEQANQNKTKAAEILGIDRVSLWRKLRRYHIDD